MIMTIMMIMTIIMITMIMMIMVMIIMIMMIAFGSVGRALHRYCSTGHGFESRSGLNFFQASIS